MKLPANDKSKKKVPISFLLSTITTVRFVHVCTTDCRLVGGCQS